MIVQLVGLVGASLILAGYYMVSSGRFAPASIYTIGVNFTGSAILCTLAVLNMQIWYILLNAAWILIAMNTYRKRGEIAWENRHR